MGKLLRRGRRVGLAAVGGLMLVATLTPPATALPSLAQGGSDECFVFSSYDLFIGVDPSFEAFSYWLTLLEQGGSRGDLPTFLSDGGPWMAHLVDGLYRDALDRAPDSAGRMHWVARLQAGASVNELGSLVYGSDEFYRRAGSTPAGFVRDLYLRLLHRPAGADEVAFWTGRLTMTNRGAIASTFFTSPESRSDRVSALYRKILGRPPEAAGLSYWKNQLLTVNDVRLAVKLASSPEFYGRTIVGDGCLKFD